MENKLHLLHFEILQGEKLRFIGEMNHFKEKMNYLLVTVPKVIVTPKRPFNSLALTNSYNHGGVGIHPNMFTKLLLLSLLDILFPIAIEV